LIPKIHKKVKSVQKQSTPEKICNISLHHDLDELPHAINQVLEAYNQVSKQIKSVDYQYSPELMRFACLLDLSRAQL
jgi:hypothetical protein